MNAESHHKFHIFSFQSSKWKALQDVDVGAMGRRKSNFLPFEEIFSHDRDKSAPGPPQIITGGEQHWEISLFCNTLSMIFDLLIFYVMY